MLCKQRRVYGKGWKASSADSAGNAFTARRFITFTGEEDRFKRILNERKKAHSLSKCRTHRLDRFLKNHNENLARLTSSAIVEFASSEGASVIVMENLSITGTAIAV